MKTFLLFTYGTLQTGFWNNDLLRGQQLQTIAYIQGFDLYCLGGCPAIRENPDSRYWIEGELWLVDSALRPRLDRLEAAYTAQTVVAHNDDQTFEAIAYVAKPRLIRSGANLVAPVANLAAWQGPSYLKS